MALFPQIANGAVSQLPVESAARYQTRVNVLDDLSEYVFADQPSPLGRWEVSFDVLSDADIAGLKAFFDAQKGRYGRFVFLDPLRNLLRWSEDFTQALWQKTGSFSIIGSQADPRGGSGASLVTNTSGAQNNLWQTIGYPPESQTFTSSVWLRAGGATTATLQCSDGGLQAVEFTVNVDSAWRRFSATKKFASSPGSVTQFLLRFAPGQSLFVFGPMLSYLPGPGDYGRTTQTAGVHPVCRFDSDDFRNRATALGVGGARLTMVEIAG